MTKNVLIVDDDATIREIVQLHLEQARLPSITAATAAQAMALVADEVPAVMVLDLGLPDRDGMEILQRMRRDHPQVPVIVLTAQGEVDVAVECMRQGAMDFLHKPLDEARLVTTVRNAHRRAELQLQVDSATQERCKSHGFETIKGASGTLQRVISLVRKAVRTDVTILITGESGTGKEVLARAVHAESTRGAGPFVPVNCGAIPESLIESELFGHEKGAFTGAQGVRVGLFEQAHGGTIFLDEIGELRPDLQVRLLRVLQERSITRLGAKQARPVDVRVVAATNRDLSAEVSAGTFREDLYYRLAVFPCHLPPLRERGSDVLLLARHFLGNWSARPECPVVGFSQEAEEALSAFSWPGNVRQLQNVVERAIILADGFQVELDDLSDEIVCQHLDGRMPAAIAEPTPSVAAVTPQSAVLSLDEVERRAIADALIATDWNVTEAANVLGIGRATLYRRIRQYGLERDAGIPEARPKAN